MSPEQLEVGKTYNVNGIQMQYKFSIWSVSARQRQYWFSRTGGLFTSSLLDHEFSRFVTELEQKP